MQKKARGTTLKTMLGNWIFMFKLNALVETPYMMMLIRHSYEHQLRKGRKEERKTKNGLVNLVTHLEKNNKTIMVLWD